jgi:hypothetical protein
MLNLSAAKGTAFYMQNTKNTKNPTTQSKPFISRVFIIMAILTFTFTFLIAIAIPGNVTIAAEKTPEQLKEELRGQINELNALVSQKPSALQQDQDPLYRTLTPADAQKEEAARESENPSTLPSLPTITSPAVWIPIAVSVGAGLILFILISGIMKRFLLSKAKEVF